MPATRTFDLILLLSATGFLAFCPSVEARSHGARGLQAGHPAPPLTGGPADWLNTAGRPISITPGKVYLIDFWEYTCVNCIRTLPYLREWDKRYAKDGLVIVGIHTPEFAFAKEHTNVARAVQQFGLTYPILIDSDYANWRAWQGAEGYWPRKYLVNAHGRVVYDHAGEGGYGDTEAKIQGLLKQAHPGIQLPKIMEPVRGEDKPGAVCYPTTAETYAGARGFRQGQLYMSAFVPGRVATYPYTIAADDGRIYLKGAWQTNPESLRHARATADLSDYLLFRYHALDCNAVIKPEGGKPFKLYLQQDDRPVGRGDAGQDVRYDESGRSYVTVDSPRMYRLVHNLRFGHHVLKLASDSPDFGLYSFTFSSCLAP